MGVSAGFFEGDKGAAVLLLLLFTTRDVSGDRRVARVMLASASLSTPAARGFLLAGVWGSDMAGSVFGCTWLGGDGVLVLFARFLGGVFGICLLSSWAVSA